MLIFVGNYWKGEKTKIVKDNVLTLAGTTGEVLSSRKMQSDTEGSLMMLCNNLRIVSQAVGADFFIVGTDGRVVICQDLHASDFIKDGDGSQPAVACPIHSGYRFSDEFMNQIRKGDYCKITNLNGMLGSMCRGAD